VAATTGCFDEAVVGRWLAIGFEEPLDFMASVGPASVAIGIDNKDAIYPAG
jgi:hypothetical protein